MALTLASNGEAARGSNSVAAGGARSVSTAGDHVRCRASGSTRRQVIHHGEQPFQSTRVVVEKVPRYRARVFEVVTLQVHDSLIPGQTFRASLMQRRSSMSTGGGNALPCDCSLSTASPSSPIISDDDVHAACRIRSIDSASATNPLRRSCEINSSKGAMSIVERTAHKLALALIGACIEFQGGAAPLQASFTGALKISPSFQQGERSFFTEAG